MVHNLEKTLDNIEKNGIKKGKIEVAKNLLRMGLTVEQISLGTELQKEEIEKIRKGMVM